MKNLMLYYMKNSTLCLIGSLILKDVEYLINLLDAKLNALRLN